MTGEPPEEATESLFVQLDISIVVPPGVRPITRVSDLLASAVLDEVTETDRVLDYGTGSGVNAILAARRTATVVAVDIVPSAVAAARSNAVRNRVADRITVLRSAGFAAVPGRFDVIIVDATEVDLRMLSDFFADVDDHLAEGGRVLLQIALTDDLAELLELIRVHRLDRTTATQRSISWGGSRVPFLVFRLTRAGSGGLRAAVEQASG
ncbi:50S ribosomal protein L11 methyltransferase [Microlunatus speluncae]|uniref:50S ribosomal protein L11 methyltransferase n=1 Tax=Microlunatus speluncae TaxID=2594267 RepID=UPI0012664488|nr:50S ribosomal protein L11 methyltransferase [Microlunatus speluncae]